MTLEMGCEGLDARLEGGLRYKRKGQHVWKGENIVYPVNGFFSWSFKSKCETSKTGEASRGQAEKKWLRFGSLIVGMRLSEITPCTPCLIWGRQYGVWRLLDGGEGYGGGTAVCCRDGTDWKPCYLYVSLLTGLSVPRGQGAPHLSC